MRTYRIIEETDAFGASSFRVEILRDGCVEVVAWYSCREWADAYGRRVI